MNEDLMEWSREMINFLMKKKNNSDYLFQIKITLNPNPLNYDGVDQVSMEVIEENQRLKSEKVVFITKHCYDLIGAKLQINNWVAVQ